MQNLTLRLNMTSILRSEAAHQSTRGFFRISLQSFAIRRSDFFKALKFYIFASFFIFVWYLVFEIMSIWHNLAQNEGTKDNRKFSEITLLTKKSLKNEIEHFAIPCRNKQKSTEWRIVNSSLIIIWTLTGEHLKSETKSCVKHY